jgi:UDP-glucose 4-epimerase
MRVVITGASGNVGTSVLTALAAEESVTSIVGIARRKPEWNPPRTTWIQADVAIDDLIPHFRGADAVIHLAWLIQPSHDEELMRRTNLDGSARVFQAAASAGVGAIVYASSVGSYSAGPKDRLVDESWPTDGVPTSTYSRHKSEVERVLDRFEAEHPRVRVVRLRPALIFKREAGAEIHRLFLGPLFPNRMLRPGLVPLVPDVSALRFQAVHSYDVGHAYRLAALREVRGAFNIAADPVLDSETIAGLLSARTVPFPETPLRLAAAATWRLHLQPADAGWFDMGTRSPLIDSARAHHELGWYPAYTALDAMRDLITGIHDGADFPTPPLAANGDRTHRPQDAESRPGSREAA